MPTASTRRVLVKPLVRDALLSFMTQRKIDSQSAFAKALKVSTGYVCDVLALRRNLSPQIIARMIKAYGLTRRQVADFHHRAARVAGWELPPLPEDWRVELIEPEPGLMRERRDPGAFETLANSQQAKKARSETRKIVSAARTARKIAHAKVRAAKDTSPGKRKSVDRKLRQGKKPKPAKERHPVSVPVQDTRAARPAGGFVPPTEAELLADLERENA